MRKYRIRYSVEFVNNLEKILQDLELKSISASNNFRDEIKAKLDTLTKNPFLWGKIISPFKRLEKYRRIILIYDYLIFYIIDDNAKTVYIVDIFNAKQDYWHLLT
ncbi:type II toxin-antitoxin system RelE/ParE family toxin [candidate division KSB1 bacterium]|nr:type II toxin-antitoxin system RelE/ParE family toxin [candidate division KSB1 bacterium]